MSVAWIIAQGMLHKIRREAKRFGERASERTGDCRRYTGVKSKEGRDES